MPVPLTQQPEAAYPGLPATLGLRFTAGPTGGTIIHDLGAAQPALACRFVVRPGAATGGALAIAGGMGGEGHSTWQATLDTDSGTITVSINSTHLTAGLTTAFAWHCVEVAIDTAAGSASLRINGVERDSASVTADPTRYAWLGGAFADAGLTGNIDLDQWVLATTPIGVPRTTPASDHADDPARWLIVYNRNNADSTAWADAYRARRGVPYANLCGLDLPGDEAIDAASFHAMRQAIAGYLADNHPGGTVVGVLLGFGVPGYADLPGLGQLTPITAYLHTNDTHHQPVLNPLHRDPPGDRPASADYAAVRLTGRIDAPDLAAALALLDRADAVTSNPLGHDQPATLHIDPGPGDPSISPVFTEPVDDWAAGDGLKRLRLPTLVADGSPINSVSNDAVAWGWRHAAPPPGFFAEPAGRRVVCLQLMPAPEPAVTARDASATHWLTTAINAGYACAAASSRPYSLSTMPLPGVFFEALRRGWTVAEAWLVAQPFVRDGVQLLGDPLMTIGFPKAGYDVYGPVNRLDQADLDAPRAVLHAGQHSTPLDAGSAPAPGEPARYLVRRIDDTGRSDLAAATTWSVDGGGVVIRPAPPCWPAFNGWRVIERNGRLTLSAVWPASLRSLGIDRVDLEAQPEGAAPSVIAQHEPSAGDRRVGFTIDRPSATTRYRFVTHQGAYAWASPWSADLGPAAAPTQPLTALEVIG